MTRRRWIADEVDGARAALTGTHAAHLARVLRARPGQEFEVVAEGVVRRGVVVDVSDQRVEFELHEEVATAVARPVTLALAVFKFDRFEWAVEKCTELGVSKIIPLIARRTDAHLAAAAEKRVQRWRRIAREASQQSRRAAEPEIAEPKKLKELLVPAQDGARIVLSEVEKQVALKDLVAGAGAVTLAIGPEGGWTEDELKLFADAGWAAATLGETILRAETAAITATAVVAAFSD